MSTKQHIYLSPHFDDAVLSSGGRIVRQVATGDLVVIATVFGGAPSAESLSDFAAAIHGRPGGGPDLITLRSLEEREALAVLGAQSRPGDYLDCIYRQDAENKRWLYDHEEALFGPVDSTERGLPYELAQVFATLASPNGSSIFYAPLAIGNHVDHQLVRRAALILQQTGHQVLFYEDFPYVTRDPVGLEMALDRSGTDTWQPVLIDLDAADIAAKVKAIAAYHSQMGVLFGEASDMESTVKAYATKVGGGTYAERQWRLSAQGSEQ
jgi:LmbE family N-acetylglucosaminyl deacetylase